MIISGNHTENGIMIAFEGKTTTGTQPLTIMEAASLVDLLVALLAPYCDQINRSRTLH